MRFRSVVFYCILPGGNIGTTVLSVRPSPHPGPGIAPPVVSASSRGNITACLLDIVSDISTTGRSLTSFYSLSLTLLILQVFPPVPGLDVAGRCLLHLSQLSLCLHRGRSGLPLRTVQVHLPPVDLDERYGHILGPGSHLLLVRPCGSSLTDVSAARISRQVGEDIID